MSRNEGQGFEFPMLITLQSFKNCMKRFYTQIVPTVG